MKFQKGKLKTVNSLGVVLSACLIAIQIEIITKLMRHQFKKEVKKEYMWEWKFFLKKLLVLRLTVKNIFHGEIVVELKHEDHGQQWEPKVRT